jgi:CRP-like cAMP-binding protein
MNSQSIAPPQSLEVMKRSPYFRGWDDQRLARLARGSRLTAYRKGEELVHKGDTLRDLQIVFRARFALRCGCPTAPSA